MAFIIASAEARTISSLDPLAEKTCPCSSSTAIFTCPIASDPPEMASILNSFNWIFAGTIPRIAFNAASTGPFPVLLETSSFP